MSQPAIGYSTPNRTGADPKKYIGGEYTGHGWSIRFAGPYNSGPTGIEMFRAALANLSHLQQTDLASESNAKLMVHLIKGIEEYDGVAPSIGGDLNALIPAEQ